MLPRFALFHSLNLTALLYKESEVIKQKTDWLKVELSFKSNFFPQFLVTKTRSNAVEGMQGCRGQGGTVSLCPHVLKSTHLWGHTHVCAPARLPTAGLRGPGSLMAGDGGQAALGLGSWCPVLGDRVTWRPARKQLHLAGHPLSPKHVTRWQAPH